MSRGALNSQPMKDGDNIITTGYYNRAFEDEQSHNGKTTLRNLAPKGLTRKRSIMAQMKLNIVDLTGTSPSCNDEIRHDSVRIDLSGSETVGTNEESLSSYQQTLLLIQTKLSDLVKSHKTVIQTVAGIALLLLYFGYFGYAMYYRFGDEGSWRLLGFTIFGASVLVFVKLRKTYRSECEDIWERCSIFRQSSSHKKLSVFGRWFIRIGVFIAVLVYVIVDVAIDQPRNLITIAGLALYILIFYVTSVCPAKVNWHTIYWGFAMQYVFALMILRTKWGYDIFSWLGDRVTEFLEYANAGAVFVFGENYEDHFFAMKVLSIVVFFFSFINIMYFLGVMQSIIKVFGRILAFCMGTSPAESINAASNIFLSMQESVMMIEPFLEDMTRSELHAIMTSGFATIAGSVLGAYISFGVPANHLLSASVMSAPAALAISKLSCPETEVSKSSSTDYAKLKIQTDSNIVEAASNGASASLKVIGHIAVNVMAFLALLEFLNATLTWFGDRVGIEKLTFELICSYILYPVPLFMGVETGNCRKIAELIGIKSFTNEFIAYSHLKTLIANRHSLNNYTDFYNTSDWYWHHDDVILNVTGEVLTGGFVSEKSEIISTYALCGFANFGAIGSMLGALGALAPRRKPELAKMVVRAMICGNVACFLTACIAGLLYKPL